MKGQMQRPGEMIVRAEYVVGNEVLVTVAEGDDSHALSLWVNQQTAAQWIAALQPIADGAKP